MEYWSDGQRALKRKLSFRHQGNSKLFRKSLDRFGSLGRIDTRRRQYRLPALFLSFLSLLLPVGAGADALRGPNAAVRPEGPTVTLETSSLKIGLQGLVWLYQHGVSPVSPNRCGFRPSCSAYGSLTVREQGLFWGVIMTADRLLRCHHFKKPGPLTVLLPDGKILDLPPRQPLPEFFEP